MWIPRYSVQFIGRLGPSTICRPAELGCVQTAQHNKHTTEYCMYIVHTMGIPDNIQARHSGIQLN